MYLIQHLHVSTDCANRLSDAAYAKLNSNDDRFKALQSKYYDGFTDSYVMKEQLLQMLQLESLAIFKEQMKDLLNTLSALLETAARGDDDAAASTTNKSAGHLTAFVREVLLPTLPANLLKTLKAKINPLSHHFSDVDSVFLDKVISIRSHMLNCLLLVYVGST